MSSPYLPPTPRWFVLVIVILALPVFSLPALLSLCPPDLKMMVWLYPVYVIVSGYLAWQCYPQRPVLAWVLEALTVLSHAAMWIMVTQPLVI